MFTWGIGFRSQHSSDWLEQLDRPMFELLSDNYMYQSGGPALELLQTLCVERPPLLHGIGLNIGGLDPLDQDYLRRLRQLAGKTRSTVISDHLCFCRGLGIETYELLPLPYTPAEVRRISERVNAVQDALGQRLTLENISAYVDYRASSMTELEFLMELADRTQCAILLDLNNLYVSCYNLGLEIGHQLDLIDPGVISYFHVSGHSRLGSCLYDSHDQRVIDPVMNMLERFSDYADGRPVILERDDANVPFQVLIAEWQRLQNFPLRLTSAALDRIPMQKLRLSTEISDSQTALADSPLQEEFIKELLRSLGILEPLASSFAWLTDSTAKHWPLHVQGLIGRWTGLVETSFRRAANVWGKELIAQLLFDYARQHPPQSGDVSRAFGNLPLFVRKHPAFRQIDGLADFVEACSVYWQILEDRNPTGQSAVNPGVDHYLQQPAKLFMPREGECDFFLLWQLSVDAEGFGKNEISWDALCRGRKGLLFVKSSAYEVKVLPAEPSLQVFYESLVNGALLEEAIVLLSSTHASDGISLETQLALGLKDLGCQGLLVEACR